MVQSSLPWGGTTVGDAGPYSDDQFSDMFRKLFADSRASQGVLRGGLNEFVTTITPGSGVSVASGRAMVDGKLFESTAAQALALTQPGGGINHYLLVARKDFTNQTVRLTLVGPDAGATPAAVQSDGTTWDLPLYQCNRDNGGNITIADVRQYAHFSTAINGDAIDDASIPGTKIESQVPIWLIHQVKDNANTTYSTIPITQQIIMQTLFVGVGISAGQADNGIGALIDIPIPLKVAADGGIEPMFFALPSPGGIFATTLPLVGVDYDGAYSGSKIRIQVKRSTADVSGAYHVNLFIVIYGVPQ